MAKSEPIFTYNVEYGKALLSAENFFKVTKRMLNTLRKKSGSESSDFNQLLKMSLVRSFEEYGEQGVELLKESIRSVKATGKTEDSIVYSVKQGKENTQLQFRGREYFKALETGRGPRQSSRQEHFDKRLEEYMQARGFPSKTSKSGVRYFRIGKSWMSGKSLAYKINTQGDRTYRRGGRELYSKELNALIKDLNKDTLELFGKVFKQGLKATLNG